MLFISRSRPGGTRISRDAVTPTQRRRTPERAAPSISEGVRCDAPNNPSVEAAVKTCDAMLSCIAASRCSPLSCAVRAALKPRVAVRGYPRNACVTPLANPLGACASPLFFTPRSTRVPPGPRARGISARCSSHNHNKLTGRHVGFLCAPIELL
jgi:hypothetical protein